MHRFFFHINILYEDDLDTDLNLIKQVKMKTFFILLLTLGFATIGFAANALESKALESKGDSSGVCQTRPQPPKVKKTKDFVPNPVGISWCAVGCTMSYTAGTNALGGTVWHVHCGCPHGCSYGYTI